MNRGMVWLATAVLALVLPVAGSTFAASENCIDATTDLLVLVKPSTVQLPGPDSLYETSQVTFGSQEMEISLVDLGVEAVGVGFPDMVGSPQYGTRLPRHQGSGRGPWAVVSSLAVISR